MHHLVEESEVFGLKLARLTKHSGYGRNGVAGQEVFPDERGDRNAEVIGEPCDEGHRRIVRPTFLEFPDMRLGDSNRVGDLLEGLRLLQPQLGNLHSQFYGDLVISRVVRST